jgi:hypothetical protein
MEDVRWAHWRSTKVRQSISQPSALVFGIVVQLLTGCAVTSGQLDAATAFGKSASTLAEGVKSAYSQAAQDEANLRTAKYVVLFGSGDYKKPLIALNPKDIPGRYAAADALAAYGQALTTLLDSKTQETDLATAASKLTGSLKNIPAKTLKEAKITPADVTDIGSIITSVGDLYLNYRREQVLEIVVPKAEPLVTKLCLLFAQDFDASGGMFGAIFSNSLNEVLVGTEKSIQQNSGSLQDRSILLSIYQQTASLQSRSMLTFNKLSAAAQSCVKTNVTLANSIKDPTLSMNDVIDFAAKAQAAYEAVRTAIDQK